jgi:hypothetical protein
MGAGVGDLFGGIFASGPKKIKPDAVNDKKQRDDEKLKEAGKAGSFEVGLAYLIYKKTHGFLA